MKEAHEQDVVGNLRDRITSVLQGMCEVDPVLAATNLIQELRGLLCFFVQDANESKWIQIKEFDRLAQFA
jgi:hypothetical protein